MIQKLILRIFSTGIWINHLSTLHLTGTHPCTLFLSEHNTPCSKPMIRILPVEEFFKLLSLVLHNLVNATDLVCWTSPGHNLRVVRELLAEHVDYKMQCHLGVFQNGCRGTETLRVHLFHQKLPKGEINTRQVSSAQRTIRKP